MRRLLVFSTVALFSLPAFAVAAPEIDAGTASGAIAFAAFGLLLIVERRR